MSCSNPDPVPSPSSGSPGPDRTRRPRPLVLCVDDEPLIRSSLSRLLELLGADVVTACDGREALELLRAGGARPDLIVTDLHMPVLGGDGLLRALRCDPALARIPIVAVSALDTEEPFDLVVAKPCGLAEVRRLLRTFCAPREVGCGGRAGT